MTYEEQKKVFARNLKRLVAKSGKSQTEISKELGLTSQAFNNYCVGISIPKLSVIQAIADYFDVGKSALTDETPDSYYLNKDAKDLVQFLYENPNYKVLFDASRNVSPEDIQFVKEMIDRINRKKEDL